MKELAEADGSVTDTETITGTVTAGPVIYGNFVIFVTDDATNVRLYKYSTASSSFDKQYPWVLGNSNAVNGLTVDVWMGRVLFFDEGGYVRILDIDDSNN